MKLIFAALCCAACALPLFAADPETGAKTPEELRSEKLEQLRSERQKLLADMVLTREKLIRTDPRLKALHKQIMDLHRQLAVRLDGKREMKTLQDKLFEKEDAIRRLEIQLKRLRQKF